MIAVKEKKPSDDGRARIAALGSSRTGTNGSFPVDAVLTERPAGALKPVSVDCVRSLLAQIQGAIRAPTARGESLDGLMKKLDGKMDDLEAILASSPQDSNAKACLEQISMHGPSAVKGRVDEILRWAKVG